MGNSLGVGVGGGNQLRVKKAIHMRPTPTEAHGEVAIGAVVVDDVEDVRHRCRAQRCRPD